MRRYLAILCSVACSSVVFAAEINLYAQPASDAKAVGKIDLTAGVIPIISSPDKVWVKVGDPRNGNVGWIKSSELSAQGGSSAGFSFTQEITNNGQSIGSPLLKVGAPSSLTPEQKELIHKMDVQRKAVQQNIQNIMKDLGQYYDAQMRLWGQEMVSPAPSSPGDKKR